MKDLGIDRFIKASTYEVTEDGVRFKVFGIPYLLSEDDLDGTIAFLMRMLERIRFMKKEKEDLKKNSLTFNSLEIVKS